MMGEQRRDLVCPRCGPDWRDLHPRRHLVLALTRPPVNGRLVCMDQGVYLAAKAAGAVW